MRRSSPRGRSNLEERLASSLREIERPLLVNKGVSRPQGVIWNQGLISPAAYFSTTEVRRQWLFENQLGSSSAKIAYQFAAPARVSQFDQCLFLNLAYPLLGEG